MSSKSDKQEDKNKTRAPHSYRRFVITSISRLNVTNDDDNYVLFEHSKLYAHGTSPLIYSQHFPVLCVYDSLELHQTDYINFAGRSSAWRSSIILSRAYFATWASWKLCEYPAMICWYCWYGDPSKSDEMFLVGFCFTCGPHANVGGKNSPGFWSGTRRFYINCFCHVSFAVLFLYDFLLRQKTQRNGIVFLWLG